MVSLFDILGPVMIGPSSSHTAGACRLGLMARAVAGGLPERALIKLHGSFAATGAGHGTQRALVGGLVGIAPDDLRLRQAFDEAKQTGLQWEFQTVELGEDVHPNTAVFELEREGETTELRGASIGGGRIEVMELNGFPSLAGAEGGCQAETGTAAAMGAAAVAWLAGGSAEQVSTAVALALQGMLGLTCDPIGGLVEIPCIYRNASAAMQAIAAAEMALAGLDFPVPADEVVDIMGEVGRRMPAAYRETAQGGLAASPSARKLVQIQPSRKPTGISK